MTAIRSRANLQNALHPRRAIPSAAQSVAQSVAQSTVSTGPQSAARKPRSRIAAQRLHHLLGAAFVGVAALVGPRSALGHGELHECGLECLLGKVEMFEGGSFDAVSGVDHRNYPPDPMVDHLRMVLRLRFESLDAKRFSAVEELRVRGVAPQTRVLSLNADGLAVSSVQRDGVDATFFSDGARISVTLDPPLMAGAETTLRFEYECVDPPAGMTFTPADPASPNPRAEVHTQGQPQQNRNWFICHDSPNERLATELIVDLPEGYVASSNGLLAAQREEGGRSVWHWVQERPHVNYLVSLVVGKFERVPLTPGASGVPMTVWVPPGMAERVERTYGRTGAMVDLFERRFGVPYPWDRYDQLVVRNFGAGGMENTSATTLQPFALLDETALLDGDIDGLIAHELGHQWFGDLITCRSWAHLWLNEGWATYASALWNEERFGHDGYLDSIRGNFAVVERDRTDNPVGMVSNEYGSPGETFGRAANPYSKGSSILHMLRRMLGEETFWAGVHRYVQRHQDTVVETDDFRHALEEVSGRDLEWFFTQWCVRPGTPRVKVSAGYDSAKGEVEVSLEQTQPIDARTPAFRFDLPIVVRTADGETTHVLNVREKNASTRIGVGKPPTMIVIDPELHVLKAIELDVPLPMLLAQAEGASTIAARRAALDALAKQDRPEVVSLLDRLARDTSRRHSERAQAVGALVGFGSPEAKARVAALFNDGIEEARVRVAAIRGVGELERSAAIATLATVAENDPSYACRVAAIDLLAKLEAQEQKDLLLRLVDVPSQSEQIKLAALEALARLDDARALPKAIEAAAFGNPDRARPRAIAAVGKLGKHDRNAALACLLPMLDDPERRSVSAAGEALADLKAVEAKGRIAAMAESGPERLREPAKRWLKAIESE